MVPRISKIIAFLIIMTFMLSMFLACGGETQTDDSGLPNEQRGGEPDNDGTEEAAAEAKILPDLDEADFGGYNFRVLVRDRTDGDWVDWNPRDVVWSEEQGGDPINDAVFLRNTYLEDKYNFNIVEIKANDRDQVYGDIRRAVGAGDDMFDMAQVPMRDALANAQNGFFLNLNEIDNINFDQPWWDQGARPALSFGNRLFFMSGDIILVNNDTCTGFVFNKGLLRDLGLDDPYPIVKDGGWTMDVLHDMMRGAAMDLNGDGVMNYQDDRFGLIGQRDTLISFLHSAGEFITQKDENDFPYITFGSERAYSAMEAVFRIMYDEGTHNAHHLEGRVPAIYPISEEMFMGNRALFMWVRLRIVENLRAMDTDFGILPLPKLNDSQANYYTDVISHTGLFMVVPVTVQDSARTGHIIEALAAESRYTIMPAYYETTLKTKMARDDDSAEMLDIIFANRVWDLGEIANFGSFSGDLIHLSMRNETNIASLFERLMPRMERDIERAIERFEALD